MLRSQLFPWKKAATVLSLVATAACGVFSQSRRPLQDHMAFHFQEIGQLREALIRGNLEAARESARAIWLQTDHPHLPRGVDSPAEELRDAARRAVASEGLEEAARATGEMGAACARCHQAADAGPDLTPSFSPRGSTADERMRRHEWGAHRMWEGIIAGSDEIWLAGAEALADAPLLPTASPGDPEMIDLAREVHDLGLEARSVRNPTARAGLYGRLLTTCSACHTPLEDPEG